MRVVGNKWKKQEEEKQQARQPRKFVHPEGGEAYPVNEADEKALREQGWEAEEEQ